MARATPRIEVLDSTLESLSANVVMPRRIRAHFDRTPAVAVEIEVVDRAPIVRTVTIWSESDHLVSNDLRVPLSSELVPIAVRAVCSTVLFGPTPEEVKNLVPPDGVEPGDVGLIGPITLIARVRQHLDEYDRIAPGSLPRRRGRPTKVIPDDELAEIAETYRQTDSFIRTAETHFFSESTARRRIKEARQAGIEC